MHICICVCVFMCRGQQSKLGFFLDCSLPCFLRQDLSQNLELACSARLTGQSAPQVLLFMPPQYCDYRCFAVPSCSSSSSSSSSKKKSKPGLHTCTENPLWVQPSPQPTASSLSTIVLAVRLEWCESGEHTHSSGCLHEDAEFSLLLSAYRSNLKF